jgi:hypothetical protein
MGKKGFQKVKYIRELNEYWDAYMYALINEITVGVAIALGLPEKQAYALARKRPETLQKADFAVTIFDKLKKILKYSIAPFRLKKKILGKDHITPQEWAEISKSLSTYWKEYSDKVAEDMTVKGFMLGRDTTYYRRKKEPYEEKSLYQVATDQYGGKMPSSIAEAYKNHDFGVSEKRILINSLSNVSMYVTETDQKLQSMIRQNVTKGILKGKSGPMIASDMYWDIQKEAGYVPSGQTAETIKKNWNRISQYEMASVYEAGILAPHEDDAMESLKNPEKAQYFVRTGGTCKWCKSRQGTLTRLVPASIVTDQNDDSLSSMGIKDPNTDIAIWTGKNNIGYYSYKEPSYRVCCPAHPHNTATMTPIDLKKEYYDPKTDRVRAKRKEVKVGDYTYTPRSHEKSKAEREARKPMKIGENRVRFNGNVYERVSPGEYNRKKAAWDKDPRLPIPVSTDSTRYDRIFGGT